MISLDTNAISDLMRSDRNLIRFRYREAVSAGQTIVVSSVVLFELQYGIARRSSRRENSLKLQRFLSSPVVVLPFDSDDALSAGEVRTALEQLGPALASGVRLDHE